MTLCLFLVESYIGLGLESLPSHACMEQFNAGCACQHRLLIAKDQLYLYNQIVSIIFLPISLNMCFGAQWNRLNEYPQHMFWLRNKKNIFRYAPLSGGL